MLLDEIDAFALGTLENEFLDLLFVNFSFREPFIPF